MYVDPSWDIMPVANPELAEGRRRRMVRESLARDPIGVSEPEYQLRHRDQLVVPFTLPARAASCCAGPRSRSTRSSAPPPVPLPPVPPLPRRSCLTC